MPRTLVTGGAGFVGSHLCDKLLNEGHDVICMDNLITGHLDNVRHLKDNPHFKFIHHNVTEFISVDGPLDYILHLASPASPKDFETLPIQILKVGSLGTHKVLGLARVKNARMLLASTSEVYGDPLIHPQPETYWGNVNPIGPRGVYDEAKRFAEAMTMAYKRIHGVDVRIVRIFNTYGPRMRLDDGRVVPTFIRQALTGQPLTIFGDGSQTRCLTYVSDLVEGIYRLLLSDFGEPVNIGSDRELTVREIADMIIRLADGESRIECCGLPTDDPKQRQPDLTRASTFLNWAPTIQAEEGLATTIQWFKENHPDQLAVFSSGKDND